LKTITKKIYRSIQLTQEETSFWNSFPNSEKSYILTGDTAQSIDFTKYQKASFCSDNLQQEIVVQEEQHWQEPNLYFKTCSSDSDSSEDPDYIPPVPLEKIITTSDDSWPDKSNSNLYDQPSTSRQQTGEQDNPSLDSESNTSTDSENQSNQTHTTPTTSTRGKPQKSKNITDLWKNTATTLWKLTKIVIVNPDPEAISTRTRSRQIQDVPDQMASHPHDLNIDAVCCDQNKPKHTESPSSFQENWKLYYKCSLSSHKDPSQPIKNY
jgi:hypothetical protein